MAFVNPDMVNFPKKPKRRLGQMSVTWEVLEPYFNLPDDVRIIAIQMDSTRRMMTLIVEGLSLEEVPEGQEAPCVDFGLGMDFGLKEIGI